MIKNRKRRAISISEPEGVLRNSQNFMKNCSGNKLDEEGNRFVGSLNKILSYFQEVSQEKKLAIPDKGFLLHH